MEFRKLNESEIQILEKNGCTSQSWSEINVSAGFRADRVFNVQFIGRIQIGDLDGTIDSPDGGRYPAMIRNCVLEHVTIGNNVYIADVRFIKSYNLGDGVWLRNVGNLTTSCTTSFGNGIQIDVLNEGGGRELMIFEQLTAQIAYLLVLYRHDKKLIDSLETLIRKFTESRKADMGSVGNSASIVDTISVKNVNIGPWAKIEGAQLLREGTLLSVEEAPSMVGEGVIAENIIIHTGSKVNGSALLRNCFIGQGVQIGRQFSAENSVFFANSEGFHGEACSLFAGPYSVTHHKSTLLIAAMTSFYNAGSGTNQSNHMYKLGPVHQGILDRGGKTGSFSYLLWPSRVGAFSAVIGKHFTNFDTSDLPFSYITEENGRSVLTPAMNLFTVGTRRDSAKWPKRDKRKDPDKLDLIHFEAFNPFIISKVYNGIRILGELSEKSTRKQEFVSYKGVAIKRLLLKTCSKYYEMLIPVFIGNKILGLLEANEHNIKTALAAVQKIKTDTDAEWLDMCGMVTRRSDLKILTDDIRDDKIVSVEMLKEKLQHLFEKYQETSIEYAVGALCGRLEKQPEDLSAQDLHQAVSEWASNSIKLNNMILKDALKEYDKNSRIGYGIDGGEEEKEDDFRQVRGTYEKNGFVKELQEENKKISGIAESFQH